MDYVSLRPCQKGDWDPKVVVELVADLGVVVAAIDPRMLFLSRSWCIFELYCAARAVLEHGGRPALPDLEWLSIQSEGGAVGVAGGLSSGTVQQ